MDDGVRINKFLGSAGYCSRREADRLVGEGRVFIDGNMLRFLFSHPTSK